MDPWQRLYVSDLDGTLLDASGRLSPLTHRSLKALLAEGLVFTVASGRSLTSIREALGDLELPHPLISSDGALISTYDDPEPLHSFSLERDSLADLLDWCAAESHRPLLDVWDRGLNFTAITGEAHPALFLAPGQTVIDGQKDYRTVADPRHLLDHEILSITLFDRAERMPDLAAGLNRWSGRFKFDWMEHPALPGWALLWVQNPRARKECALEVLQGLTGHSAASTVVFGDERNDLGLFESGAYGVAVANARPEIQARASETIGPHHEDAVIRWLARTLGRQIM